MRSGQPRAQHRLEANSGCGHLHPEERMLWPLEFQNSENHPYLGMNAASYLSLVPLHIFFIYFPLLCPCLPVNLVIIICLPMQFCPQEENRFIQPSVRMLLINWHPNFIYWSPLSCPCGLFCR